MFLKFKIHCTCHCSYTTNEAISTDKIACPNCGIEYPYSKEVISILKTAQTIPSGSMFEKHSIQVISQEEDMKNFEL